MASFDTDLARYIAEYDAAERADEIERAMRAENSDYAVNGEEARFIPANFVLDAEVSVATGRGWIPGCYVE